MLAPPSTELVARARAGCGTRTRGPSGPRARASASSAAFRSTSRASATLKRGASQGRREASHAGSFFFGVGFPNSNWGSIYLFLRSQRDGTESPLFKPPLSSQYAREPPSRQNL